MSNSDERVLRTMRMMAWARAKGEIDSILSTFWGEEEQFDRLTQAITVFVKEVEDNALAE